MISDIHTILSDLSPAMSDAQQLQRAKLGESFTGNATIRELMALMDETNSSGSFLGLKVAASGKNGTSALSDNTVKLSVFIVLLNRYFDVNKNKLLPGSEEALRNVAYLLGIEPEDYSSVMKFYYSNKPYVDTTNAAYFAFEQKNDLVRSKGVNIYFTHKHPGEILYLKYLENYNVFISKTFITDVFKEEVKTREINIIDEKMYTVMGIETLTFNALTANIKHFDPLQYVEVSETSYHPRILLDPVKCLIAFSGASSPISTTTYFEPIFEWLNLFDIADKKALSIHFKFKYYNTYTSKFLLNFVLACNRIAAKGKDVSYYWYHDIDDDEMREFGEYLQTQCSDAAKFHVLETY